MIVSSASPDVRIVFTKSRCSAVSVVSMRMLVMPMTPFIGVRISCDMDARNSLFARDAKSALGLRPAQLVLRLHARGDVVLDRDEVLDRAAVLRTTWTSRWRWYFRPDFE